LDYLRKHNRTFAGYYQDDIWMLGAFEDLTLPENAQFIHNLPLFFDTVAEGNLPDFTWIQPRFGTYGVDKVPTWQHPDASVLEGERLIKDIYEAIRRGPKWNETLFIITYDEHGGFYDHVAPPRDVPPPDEFVASNGFRFDRLGIRLPTIAISPYINKGTIVHDALPLEQPTPTSAFDLTSIMATANILLGLKTAQPLGKRMAWANTFAGLVSESPLRSDCLWSLPELPARSPSAYLEQRLKPLNEHMESQILFYCAMNHRDNYIEGSCEGNPRTLYNQGLASDWLAKESEKWLEKLKTNRNHGAYEN
jgi:phospholipase C